MIMHNKRPAAQVVAPLFSGSQAFHAVSNAPSLSPCSSLRLQLYNAGSLRSRLLENTSQLHTSQLLENTVTQSSAVEENSLQSDRSSYNTVVLMEIAATPRAFTQSSTYINGTQQYVEEKTYFMVGYF